MAADDHEARMMAQRALDRIEGHEDLCGERWEQSRKALERVDKNVHGLYRWRWAAAVSLIALLLGLIFAAIKLGAALNRLGVQWP